MGAGYGQAQAGLRVGDTYLSKNPSWDRHLWIVVATDPTTKNLLAFNLTTRKAGCDTSCLVSVGEHRWVTHDTYVTYMRGRLVPPDLMVLSNDWDTHDPVSNSLLNKVRDGALKSAFTKEKYKELIRQCIAAEQQSAAASGANTENPAQPIPKGPIK